ncbi:MAG: hypothetical protein JO016_16980 [Actinobacteria bacterium]|nr:hypothetical protein [Actinomycetota bacterium]
MDDRDRQRLAVAHRILDATRHQSFREETVPGAEGRHVFVPALPDDTMAELFDRLRSAHGPIHVAVPEKDGITIFVMALRKQLPRHASRSIPSDPCPVSRESEVSMVLEYMRLRGGRIFFREAIPEIALEIVEGPTALPAL